MRMCLERLPKSELHGQKPIVTLPTKAALAQFESQQKTRPIPPQANAPRGQAPMQPMQGNFPPQQQHPQSHPPRMMMPPNAPPGNFRPMQPQNMPMQNQGPPRMQVAIEQILFSLTNDSQQSKFKNQLLQWNSIKCVHDWWIHVQFNCFCIAILCQEIKEIYFLEQEVKKLTSPTFENILINLSNPHFSSISIKWLNETGLPTLMRRKKWYKKSVWPQMLSLS